MTLETQLDAALKVLAGGASYCEEAPPEQNAPYLVWSIVADTPSQTLEGPSAINARVQVDIFAATRLECNALVTQVVAALIEPPIRATEIMRQNLNEAAVGLKRAIVEFSIWH